MYVHVSAKRNSKQIAPKWFRWRDINEGTGTMKETNKGRGYTQKPARAGSLYHPWDWRRKETKQCYWSWVRAGAWEDAVSKGSHHPGGMEPLWEMWHWNEAEIGKKYPDVSLLAPANLLLVPPNDWPSPEASRQGDQRILSPVVRLLGHRWKDPQPHW